MRKDQEFNEGHSIITAETEQDPVYKISWNDVSFTSKATVTMLLSC